MSTYSPRAFDSLTLDKVDAARSYGLRSCMIWVLAVRVIILWTGLFATAHSYVNHTWATGIPWLAYDGIHYYGIAAQGYPTPSDADANIGLSVARIAYFPLYPLVGRTLSLFMPLAAAMLLLANVSAVVGLIYFYLWTKELTGNVRAAWLGTLFIACYPGAVFFSACMTEGPFFMLCAMSLYLLAKEKYVAAALVCALASLTRPTAVALAITIGLVAMFRDQNVREFFQAGWAHVAKRTAIATVLGGICMSGTMAYMAYLTVHYEQPGWELYGKAQKTWEDASDSERAAEAKAAENAVRHSINASASASISELANLPAIQPEHATFHERYSLPWFISKVNEPQAWNRALGIFLLLIMLAGLLQPLGVPRALMALPLIIWFLGYVPNHGLRASSLYRYEMAGLPMFLLLTVWLSKIERRNIYGAIIFMSLMVQIYYAYRFSIGMWVG